MELGIGKLGALGAPALRNLAFLIGASAGGNKAARVHNIARQAALLDKLQGPSVTFTSIDTGVVNLAVASVTCNTSDATPTLTYWDKTNLEQRYRGGEQLALTPSDTAPLASVLARDLQCTPELRNTSLFTIEKQRTRTVGSSAVSDPILKLNVMEHLIFAQLAQLAHRNIVSSDPGRMTKYWVPREREVQTGLKSKRLRVDLVRQLVLGGPSPLLKLQGGIATKVRTYNETPRRGRIPSLFDALQLVEPLNGVRKDDDLTDSLLHALAWAQWYMTYTDMKRCMALDTAQLADFIEARYARWEAETMI